MERARSILNGDFGMKKFRNHQEAVIQRLLVQNKSALAIMPTGSGKSLCFQIPSLCLDGLTLVISPLLALMKDQVDGLIRKGVPAGRLDSTMSTEEYYEIIGKLRAQELKLLYVAPERLNMEGFVEMIKQHKISLLAVDESHCVAEWGNAFRPDYLKIARFAVENNVERVLCLTATATLAVAQGICRAFAIDEKAGVFRAPSYRSNLKLEISSVEGDKFGEERTTLTIQHLRNNPGASIVYVTSQKNTENVAMALTAADIPARAYHAGLGNDVRKEVQEWFMTDPKAVVCATIAFGMGIDKADIRNVIHFNMPKTLEGYSQEVGRAGRDGLPARCIFYLCPDDRKIIQSFARGNTPSRVSVRNWFRNVCEEAMRNELGVNSVLVMNLYSQSREFDIRDVTLGLLYAQLELRFQYLRAITPMNAEHKYKTTDAYENAKTDTSPAAVAIIQSGAVKKLWTHVAVDEAARIHGLERSAIVSKLQEWSDSGWIDLTASQRRNRYLITKVLPTDPEEVQLVADAIYEQIEKREMDEVNRMNRVFSWAKANECLPRGLSTYFGDDTSFSNGAKTCGQCTVCVTGKAVPVYDPGPPAFNALAFDGVLECTSIRDDARFLARIAFGITSPRITKEKLSTKNPAFGSMDDHDFDELLNWFQKVVDEFEEQKVRMGQQGSGDMPALLSAEATLVDTVPPPVAAKPVKRKYQGSKASVARKRRA